MKNPNYSRLFASMALISIFASCNTANRANNKVVNSDQISNVDIDSDYLIVSNGQQNVIDNNNQFAFDLFKNQKGMDSKVISPISVSFVLNMLANGADGNTESDIRKVLHEQGVTLDVVNEAYKVLMSELSREKSVSINIANSIVANKNITLDSNFEKIMSTIYNANISSLDFTLPSTVEAINKWCNKQTDGMIPSIINELNPSDVSVVLNAIYFNGIWAKKFDKENTKLERFQGYTRDIKRVNMMHQEDDFLYVNEDKYAAVQIPYDGYGYSMTILLPNKGCSIDDIMNTTDANKLKEIFKKMERCKVDLKLPRFTIQTETQLKKPLSALGAKSIFDTTADFSRMCKSNFLVSEILQKAKIEVAEEGTKAAAVTAAIMTMSANPIDEISVKFHVDHPFVYLITENKTGAIFFIGQYTGDDC